MRTVIQQRSKRVRRSGNRFTNVLLRPRLIKSIVSNNNFNKNKLKNKNKKQKKKKRIEANLPATNDEYRSNQPVKLLPNKRQFYWRQRA